MKILYEVDVKHQVDDIEKCHRLAAGRTYLFRPLVGSSEGKYTLHILSEHPKYPNQSPFYMRGWEERYVFEGTK